MTIIAGKNIVIIFLFTFLLFKTEVKAQFGRKATFSAFAGVMISNPDEKKNEAGKSENLFGKYSPGPVLGGNLFYNVNKNLSIGGKLRYLYAFKEKFKINKLTFGLDMKYNFLPSDKKVSPYVMGEFNLSLAGIKQSSYEETFNPDASYSVKDPTNIEVEQITYREPDISLSFIPMFGFSIAPGVDLRLMETVGFFVQVEYNSTFAKSKSIIQEYFPDNKSNFSYILPTVGVKFNLFKSTSLY